jgi:hypothetical protein
MSLGGVHGLTYKLRIGTYWRIYSARPRFFQSLWESNSSWETDPCFLKINQRIGEGRYRGSQPPGRGIAASDFRTMESLGKRVAEAAVRWQEAPLAQAA